MAENDFIMAVDPGGNKRLVPAHYLDNPAFGFKLPPSEKAKAKEPADTETSVERVEEPAASATSKKVKEPAAAGETEEAR